MLRAFQAVRKKLRVESPVITAQRGAMRPAGVPSPLYFERAPRFAGARPVFIVVGGLAMLAAGAGPAAAQNKPDKPVETSVSFQVRQPSAAVAYVGDEACNSCHQEKSASYHRTAHALTSSLPSRDSIHGSFAADSNVLRTVNPDLYFKMEAGGNGFSQTAILRSSSTEAMTRTERFDIVVGSGRKGQTYLFWDGDELFQLPVSYWTEVGSWVNSPGYVDGTANFERPIAARCLECHASSFRSRAPPESRYDKGSLVLGISCEKCHSEDDSVWFATYTIR